MQYLLVYTHTDNEGGYDKEILHYSKEEMEREIVLCKDDDSISDMYCYEVPGEPVKVK